VSVSVSPHFDRGVFPGFAVREFLKEQVVVFLRKRQEPQSATELSELADALTGSHGRNDDDGADDEERQAACDPMNCATSRAVRSTTRTWSSK
jgi:hypothetical protein